MKYLVRTYTKIIYIIKKFNSINREVFCFDKLFVALIRCTDARSNQNDLLADVMFWRENS